MARSFAACSTLSSIEFIILSITLSSQVVNAFHLGPEFGII